MMDGINILGYWAHRHLAKERFHSMKILNERAFEIVDWEIVYNTLRVVPKLLQWLACKQVMGAAGMMEWDKTVVCKCPICLQECNTCAHVLFCCHPGRVEMLHHTLDLVEGWLEEAEMDPEL